jgi:serine O-acetyltransferase
MGSAAGEASAHQNPAPLLALLREDRISHERNVFSAGFQALAVHRFGVWQSHLSWPARAITRPLYGVLYGFVRNVYGIEIPRTARVGRRVVFGHQHGIVIHDFAEIGDGCIIRHGVSLAAATGKTNYERWAAQAPKLGRGVKVGVGAVIVGGVTIGDEARIGPNAVVTTNVPAGATVVVPPPRIVKPRVHDRPAAGTGDESTEVVGR